MDTTTALPVTTAARPLPEHTGVLVVGTGFSGLAVAIGLQREGRSDFLLLERGDDVGGTWRDNAYPGCACDVPSHLYSFSFAPNPSWSRSFSPQPEIQAYLQRTAEQYGLREHLHTGTELLEARWDDDAQRWDVRTSRGSLTCDVLVAATGALSEPKVPDLPGLDAFAGTTFHSAAWRHDHDLTGRRVAVLGTGASAIQFVPHVQERAAHLTLLQRTAPWVLPRRDRPIGRRERWVYENVPGAQRAARYGIYWLRESWVLGFAGDQRVMRLAELEAKRYLRKQVPDPALRAKLTPAYRLGCKRVLLSNTYFPAVSQPDVDVVTDRVVEVLPHAVVTESADGTRREHEVDTIILGTGFKVTEQPVAERVVGRDGRTLAEHWAATGGMQALHGTTIAGFPAFALMVGPNTGLGHTSITLIIEAQVRYLLDLLRQVRERGLVAVEPRPEVQQAYADRLQRELQGTVWNAGGCASWYLDEHGRNTTLWPTFTFTYMKELSRCDLDAYVPVERRAAVPA